MADEYDKVWEKYNGQTPVRNDVIIAKVNGKLHQNLA